VNAKLPSYVRGHALRKLVKERLRAVNEQFQLLSGRLQQCRLNIRTPSNAINGIREKTRIRRMEAEKIAAEKASKAKDDFLAVLSHELRTPLTPALFAASYLANHADHLPPDLREEVAIIQRNIELEARLIDDLLDFTRIVRGKIELRFEIVDAHRVLRETLEVVGDEIIEKELDVKMSLTAKEHHIWADPVRIRQVFWNVIRNAAKFTPSRGHIEIRSLNDEQGRLQLKVSDTGVGIAPEAQNEVFNAFKQGSRSITCEFGGLGLGLTISKSLIDLHRGTIEVESAGKNCGALFTITLDALPANEISNKDQPSGNVRTSKSLRLLLVEDHDDTRRMLSRLLSRCGHKVSSTDHVEAALKLLETKRFDAVVSDIGLPDRSGYELIALAKKRHPVKGIALSGFGMEEDVQRSLAAGFDHHLTKPVDIRNLRALLNEIAT
jgi:signal transduction histidine kinase